MKTWILDSFRAVAVTLALIVACGVIYPLLVFAGGHCFFRSAAEGSLVYARDGVTVIGSSLLAQNFSSDQYFHPRPSAAGNGYDATSSGGTNLGPTSAKLLNGSHAKDTQGRDMADPGNFEGIKDLVAAYRASNGLAPSEAVPADAVTRSGSGLDPEISVANALLQAGRVARARQADPAQMAALVHAHTRDRAWGVFGEPGVNVLLLNLDLDKVFPAK